MADSPERLPLFRNHSPESTIAWLEDGPITNARLLADATELADRLPDSPLLNLCERRYPFLVGVVAALLAGRLLLLPPSRAATDLQRLAASHPGCRALCDVAVAPEGIDRVIVETGRATADWSGTLPSLPADREVIELYTSGSSGQPTRHRKRWGELVAGAQLTGRRLGLERMRGGTIIATVPSQHMFGLEASLLLPLQWGLACDDGQPLLPADIATRLASVGAPRILVTTPLHLRALVESAITLPALAATLSATSPLDESLATRYEAMSDAPLYEIYGSTESGAVASRRSRIDTAWQPLDGITLAPTDNGVEATGGHLLSPRPLHDRIERLADGRFRLLGRNSDLIKVAGKRASLADLTARLQQLPGVVDGCFFQPGESSRLCAFVVGHGLDTRELLAALRQQLDPVFLPRPLYRVESLPRNATGKLPRRALEKLYHHCRQEGT